MLEKLYIKCWLWSKPRLNFRLDWFAPPPSTNTSFIKLHRPDCVSLRSVPIVATNIHRVNLYIANKKAKNKHAKEN